RCCIDFRRLNAVTKRDVTPLPRVDDLLQKLSPEKVFTGVDMWKVYWQVPLHDDDVEKTAFNTPFGLYEWLFMPMGITNGGATYEAMMQEIFQEHLYTRVVVYLDGVFIFSDSEDAHLEDVMAVFKTLRSSGAQGEGGQGITLPGGNKMSGVQGVLPLVKKGGPDKDREVPYTRKGIQSFLGMVMYYRGFVPYLSDKAGLLNDLLKKGRDPGRDWSREHDCAIEEIKAAFSDAPLLALYDPSNRLLLQTDSTVL
ncbi:unnamed protein product, partial [Heterosigma akashiwo]